MPLTHFIPSLSRLDAQTLFEGAKSPHPAHTYLKPLLLNPKGVSSKYHTELPRILLDGGGAGEMEETMMWYAVTHEKTDGVELSEDSDGVWMDEKWRENYLEKMERRECVFLT